MFICNIQLLAVIAVLSLVQMEHVRQRGKNIAISEPHLALFAVSPVTTHSSHVWYFYSTIYRQLCLFCTFLAFLCLTVLCNNAVKGSITQCGAAKCLQLIYGTVWHFVGSACMLGWQNLFHSCCDGVSSNRFVWLLSVKCKSCCPYVSDYIYFAYLRIVHRHVKTSVTDYISRSVLLLITLVDQVEQSVSCVCVFPDNNF